MVWSMGVRWYVLVFHPFWPFFFRFKRCFWAPFTALGVERLLETPPFLLRLCSILWFRFSKKEIPMVDTYIPPSKKEQTKGSPETCFFCLEGFLVPCCLKTQKLPWKIWMGPFSHQIYNCIFPCCFFGFCFAAKNEFRGPNIHPPPALETSTLRFPRSEFERRTERGLPGFPGWNSPIAAPIASMGLVCLPYIFHKNETRCR